MSSNTPVTLSATPAVDQLVSHDGTTYTTIREGLAYILVPPNSKTSQNPQPITRVAESVEAQQQPQSVFYNPIQQFNRDLSVLAIKAFGEDLCERRRAKWEQRYEKLAKRKANKEERKRKRGHDNTEELSAKTQKLEDIARVDNTGAATKDTEEATTLPEAADHGKDVDNSERTNGVERPGPPFRILDALSATGLRALRYAQEIPFATSITANDMDQKAVRSIQIHLEHNKLTDRVLATTSNALAHMYAVAHPSHDSHGPHHVSAKYDVIDLDPYGTAAPFLDAAIQALNDGGLLCVTCTDSGVFASCGYSEKTFSLYGGMPAKGPHCHETGLRLVLHAIATTAAKYGIAIEPLLSLSIDFYVRLFVRVRRSPADVKFLAGKTMLVHECDVGCGAWSTQLLGRNTKRPGREDGFTFKHSIAQSPSTNRRCEHCGSVMHVAGPMWAGTLHHPGFVSKIIEDAQVADKEIYATTARIEGMLSTALDELLDTEYVSEARAENALIPKTVPEQIDQQPFFFLTSRLAKVLHAQAPSEAAIKGALRHAGYRVSRSHCKPGSIKTNASWSAIWEVMREWVKQKKPVAKERYPPGSPGWKIMGYADVAAEATAHADADTNGIATTASAEDDSKEDPGTTKKMKVFFDEALGRDKPGKKLVRYQTNPRENWGPMSRAK